MLSHTFKSQTYCINYLVIWSFIAWELLVTIVWSYFLSSTKLNFVFFYWNVSCLSIRIWISIHIFQIVIMVHILQVYNFSSTRLFSFPTSLPQWPLPRCASLLLGIIRSWRKFILERTSAHAAGRYRNYWHHV